MASSTPPSNNNKASSSLVHASQAHARRLVEVSHNRRSMMEVARSERDSFGRFLSGGAAARGGDLQRRNAGVLRRGALTRVPELRQRRPQEGRRG